MHAVCEVETYEVNNGTPRYTGDFLEVNNSRHQAPTLVFLTFDGFTILVDADELRRAIDRVTQ